MLISEFIAFSMVVWIAGVWLVHSTDANDSKYKLGRTF